MFTKFNSAYFFRVAAKSSTNCAMRSGSSKWPQCPDFSSHSSLQSQEIQTLRKYLFLMGKAIYKQCKAPAALPPKTPSPVMMCD